MKIKKLNGGENRPVSLCSVCSGEFDIEGEGGIFGHLGILPVYFCPTCFSGVTDLAAQVNGFEDTTEELDRAVMMLNDRLKRIEDSEDLLKEITSIGSHYQIKEKIVKYFKKYSAAP